MAKVTVTSQPGRSIGWLVVLILLGTKPLLTNTNEASRLALTERLLTAGVAHIEASPFFDPMDVVFSDGHFYSDKPPLLPVYTALVLRPVRAWLTWDKRRMAPYMLAVLTSAGAVLLTLPWLLKKVSHEMALTPAAAHWTSIGLLTATPLLPFSLVYNDHIIEAGLAVMMLWQLVRHYRRPRSATAIGLGAAVGLLFWLHPLVGLTFFVTTMLALLWAGGDQGWRYLLSCAVILLAGAGLNLALYKSVIPLYFRPELYLYAPHASHPDIPTSPWLAEPALPGLAEQAIITRWEELQLPPPLLQNTLTALIEYQQYTSDLLLWLWHRWRVFDVLTFNPLVLFSLVLCGLLLRSRHWRFISSWIILTAIGLYAASAALRAVPGLSFGNRHLLPIVPLLLIGAAPALRRRANGVLFRLLFWPSFAMMLPGTWQPWQLPREPFMIFNRWLWMLLASLVIIWLASAAARKWTVWFSEFVHRYRCGAAIFLIALAAAELGLYAPSLREPRLYVYSATYAALAAAYFFLPPSRLWRRRHQQPMPVRTTI